MRKRPARDAALARAVSPAVHHGLEERLVARLGLAKVGARPALGFKSDLGI